MSERIDKSKGYCRCQPDEGDYCEHNSEVAELQRQVYSPANTVTDNSAVIERLERERDEARARAERLREALQKIFAWSKEIPMNHNVMKIFHTCEDALNETPAQALKHVMAEADEKSSEIAYALLEMHGTVSEYQDMPCESLRKRMFSTLRRHKSRVKLAGEIYADQIRRGEDER